MGANLSWPILAKHETKTHQAKPQHTQRMEKSTNGLSSYYGQATQRLTQAVKPGDTQSSWHYSNG